jgi:general secretion pathway protein A
MYYQYFGLNENPFMLAPDPKYLFLGRSQEEAIAHLLYAISQGEGFIALIGKPGVGKTTVCRTFIERLDGNTEVAYIFKPEPGSIELLKKINAAFNIDARANNVKDQIDRLNVFLMNKRLEGKKVVLFIDEAQDLKRDVLEQIRLLSNLETTRDKLLQIVLIGDFKLAAMLGSHDLRQIGQRVSVNYTAQPLTVEETRAYVQHRLRIAGQGSKPRFDLSAWKPIYKYSQGIPRAINIVCDRSLFKAYRSNSTVIDGDIVKSAILDLVGRSALPASTYLNRRRVGLIAAGCGLFLLIFFVAYLPRANKDEIVEDTGQGNPAVILKQERPEPPGQSEPLPAQTLSDVEIPPPTQRESRPDLQAETPPLSRMEPDDHTQPIEEMTHSVQVGAFIEIKNAETLMAALQAKGYPARMIQLTDSRGLTWHMVRIGDYPSREIARRQAESFSSREKMDCIVRPYRKM